MSVYRMVIKLCNFDTLRAIFAQQQSNLIISENLRPRVKMNTLNIVMRKPIMPYANNKCADQPAHPRSLISTFVVRFLDSIVHMLAKSKISRLQLVSVAEQAGLSLTWSHTAEDWFSRDVAHISIGAIDRLWYMIVALHGCSFFLGLSLHLWLISSM